MRDVRLLNGDCLEVLKTLPDASVDAVVTDPPYELGFMGKGWDASGIAYNVGLWREVLRVLKPGGHLLAFGGTRTYHRMAVAIEDAGFEVRDSLHWIYGSGFPKSLNVSKAIDKAAGAERGGSNWRDGDAGGQEMVPVTAPATDAARQWGGWGTALKPAHEPVVVARKPLVGTVADNVQQHGTGALNIDGCRLTVDSNDANIRDASKHQRTTGSIWGNAEGSPKNLGQKGRWPPNILLSHTPECGEACAEDCAVAEMDRQSGTSKSAGGRTVKRSGGGNVGSGKASEAAWSNDDPGYGDVGGASRFFPVFRYQAKASRAERERGLHEGQKASHPTVKPVALMRWLVRLVTPLGGMVLDPFMGSGTTGVAAREEGFAFVGIERELEYFRICEARIGSVEVDVPAQKELFA